MALASEGFERPFKSSTSSTSSTSPASPTSTLSPVSPLSPAPPSSAPALPPGDHIALLLPTGSEAFARAAEAVHAGFSEAARKSPPTLPVRLHPVSDDPQQVLSAYRKALAAGARLVVGPLTRNGVTALAASPGAIKVPTLVLNVPDQPPASEQLYMLSLQVEAEARQVARLALNEGRKKAFTVSEATPLAKRMREAFVDEFERGGGFHIADYAHSTEASALQRLRDAAALGVADMVFFALGAGRLNQVRPAFESMTGYGTSQLNPVNVTHINPVDLTNVRFVDMPWMVQPDHPAVMVYDRWSRHDADLQRLYALGIDAYRVAEDLLRGKREFDLDGVTGRLQLGGGGRFQRGLLVTLIDSGRLVVLGETRP